MKTINLEEIKEFFFSPEILEKKAELLDSADIFDFKINETLSEIFVQSEVDKYGAKITIANETILEFSCNCEIYLSSKKICSHIFCLIETYNQYINFVSRYQDVKNVSFEIAPIIFNQEDGSKKIVIEFYFNCNYKKFFVSNVKELFLHDNKYYFFPLCFFNKEQIENDSITKIEELRKMLLSKKIIFEKKQIIIDINEISDWLDFFNKLNITFFYQNNFSWNITNYFLDGQNYEFDEQCKPGVNNKRKFSLKVNKEFSFFYISTNEYVFLFSYLKPKSTINIYKYDINNFSYVNDFCEFINKQLSKNNFYKLYLAVKKLFANYERIIEYLFIIKNNISKTDPVLQIKIYFDKILNVLVSKLSFLYGETEYLYKENEDNYFKRERFLEQKLLEPVLNFFNYYNVEFKVFEIVDHQKYLEFVEWSRKIATNDLYDVKFSEDLIFKPKIKKEFKINSSSFENNFLKIDWKIDGFTREDMLKIISSYQQKIKYVTLSNNKIINLELEIDFDKLNEELKLLNTSINDISNGTVLVNKLNSNYFLENFNFKNKDELKNHFEKLYGDNNEFVKNELPDNLKKILKNYQVSGYLWLKKLIYLQAGGILADEMGLGKTIQTLSLLADIYFNKKTNLPSLVVCPSSLVYNWQKEFHQYAPYLKIAIIDGNQNERLKVLNQISKYDVIVTSYHLLNKDLEFYKNIEFYIQILDEAQKIKNHYTQFSKDSKSINSKHKIALTGTPIENNLLELWSIFDYLMNNFLYDYRTFKINFQEKIINKDEETLKKLKTKIAPFILRRTKKDVLKELPSKTYKILTCDFNETQKEMYFTELNKSKLIIKKEISQNTINKQSIYIFSVLTKLRQICCSPKLIYENCETNGSKFNLCIELIKDLIKNDDKILLFSQFTSMIDLIAQELKKLNISFYTLTGETNKKERIELVNDFNNKKNVKVFLISLKAGGTGLTLTSANAVIHYDPWWNQSLENQATDRAHRIGQEKNVFIYKLIAKNSIEEKILSLQESKKEIIEQIFSENSTQKSSINMSEILKVLDIE